MEEVRSQIMGEGWVRRELRVVNLSISRGVQLGVVTGGQICSQVAKHSNAYILARFPSGDFVAS